MTTSYRVHGTTDETDTCEICGKVDLRSVIMLAILEDGEETGELIYAGSTCGPRKLAKTGTRTTPTRLRDAATAADRVRAAAAKFADEMSALTLNQYIAANAVAYLNANGQDTTAALAAARAGYVDLQTEIAEIRSGRLTGTRFARSLPTL